MRRPGPITVRHTFVAAIAVVLLVAMLAWWVAFYLGESQARMGLERRNLLAQCRLEASRATAALADARSALALALAAGRVPGDSVAPAPFVSWSATDEPAPGGWSQTGGDALRLTVTDPWGSVTATADTEWSRTLLQLPHHLERTVLSTATAANAAGRRPCVALPEPFSEWAVQPSSGSWSELRSDHHRRSIVMLSEAAIFSALLVVVVFLLRGTLRREAELELRYESFLSAITHELRSPLSAMRLSLETILRGRADSTASVRFLENALQDTERLQSLVQKVLEVTRFGLGDGSLQLHRGSLTETVRDSIDSFLRRPTYTGARIDRQLADDVWVEIDEEAFDIVTTNLLENAVKYGGNVPGVAVDLRVEGDVAVLDVKDNGHGIAAADAPLVFNRFYRGGDEMTRTAQGIGLGLYLVQQIVGAHRGQVAITATGPGGTTFRVTLPGAEVWEDRP